MILARRTSAILLCVGALAATSACGAGRGGDDRLAVSASLYALEFLAERVGGDTAEVTGLTPAGTEPHDLTLDGKARAGLEATDVVLYLGDGYQPDVEDAIADLPEDAVTVDLLEAEGVSLLPPPAHGDEHSRDEHGDEHEEEHAEDEHEGSHDPHVWLDPAEMVVLSEAVAAAFAEADPDHADTYRANQEVLAKDLEALDGEFRDGLADCAATTIVTSHAAFGYLAEAYGLTQVPIAGLSPDDEPDPATLAEITDSARDAGAKTVFFEEALPPKLAETVAREIGAGTDLLAVMEFAPEDGDYLTVMRGNLERLRTGLDCR
ncbi:metal ABC transporter substrate-binding protein [Nocardioides sp. NPDC057772]|uniref:metal ABC transporter substrate-binding protein n=1 Tax=Nocardioides sp. NPDC057772 TaxID=3346245 RepID=UPI00366D108B